MFRPLIASIVCLCILAVDSSAKAPLDPSEVTNRSHLALAALDRYMETWNTRDASLWATTLHYPHVRPGPGAFELFDSREAYVKSVDFEATLATGWRYSRWETRKVLQVGLDTVHAMGQWKRYREDGGVIAQTMVTYVITRKDDGWRIQSRFAAGALARDAQSESRNADQAMQAVRAFNEAFNSHDPQTLSSAIHYPHVRIGDGNVLHWKSPAEYLTGPEPGRQRTWAETRIDHAEVVQTGENGANVALEYSRRNAAGEILSQYEAIYLVTNRGGQWKVQAQSILGP